MNFPTIPNTIEMLRRHKLKQGYTDAQLATDLALFGWTWQESRIADLMTGRSKPTADEAAFFRLYLLRRFHDYNRGLTGE